MREILFKGKRVDGHGWVEGCLIKIDTYCCILEFNCQDYGCTYLDSSFGYIDGSAIPVIPETIGQFTGLVDKNGEKIFEGDIVEFPDSGVVRSIIFDERLAEFKFNPKDLVENHDGLCLCVDNHECAIIGNIHDNPELLEKRGDVN